jgi:hypothetical protein
MKLSIEPFGPQHEAAAAAFNRRVGATGKPVLFLLPEHSRPAQTVHGVTVTNYVAVDAEGAVRGGFISWEHSAIVGKRVRHVINIQSPLSEGIFDRAHVAVGPRLIQTAIQRTPYVYLVGMGSEGNPLPRLLKAMGFGVRTIPFFFRMIDPARCLRQLGPLRNAAWKRLVCNIAGLTGIASLGAAVVHKMRGPACGAASSYKIEEVSEWGSWADPVWDDFAKGITFGVMRDAKVQRFFYPLHKGTPRVWRLLRGSVVDGWFSLMIARMADNPYFGNLAVATLTDCIGSESALKAGCISAIRKARELGADLLITNLGHETLQRACVAAGYRQGPSNFLFATSKALTQEISANSVYVTRRDGDGLVNLR